MTEDTLDDLQLVARFIERLPLGRVAEPADIAAVVAVSRVMMHVS